MKHAEVISETLINEGSSVPPNYGYVNHPDDPGGETYCGITRVYHPEWQGWELIDRAKEINAPSEYYRTNALIELARLFYEKEYYSPLMLDMIEDSDIAYILYDTNVLIGYGMTVKWAQVVCNVLNQSGNLWTDIVDDGIMGPNTADVINNASARSKSQFIFYFSCLRGEYHIEKAKKNNALETFVHGWANRMFEIMLKTMRTP